MPRTRRRRRRRERSPQGLCIPKRGNNPVPLKDVKVEASLQGFVCRVTSTLRYENTDDEAIETAFIFPVDEGSAVYEFEATLDDRKIVGECIETEEGHQTEEEATDQDCTTDLLCQDSDSADVFKCHLGNLPAHKTATIRLSYVQELGVTTDRGIQFVLPTPLNPRYDSGATEPKPRFAKSISLPAMPYSLQFKAAVLSDKAILKISSEYQDIEVDISGDRTSAALSLSEHYYTPEHNLSFTVYLYDTFTPGVIMATGDETSSGILKNNVLMLNFFPELDKVPRFGQQEFIFVIDRSGSMLGWRIYETRKTLLLLIKSLPLDCYFNIVSFGSNGEFLFPEGSRRYSKDTVKLATDLQRNMTADRGGTDFLEPLQDIFARPLIEGYPRQCFLLTDGVIDNVSDVISLVKSNNENTRVFTFGIGRGASTALVKGLARAGKGKAEFVTGEQKLQTKVIKMLKCTMQESVKNLALDIRGVEHTTVVPEPIPQLYSGDHLVLYAIIPDINLQTATAELIGNLGTFGFQFTIPLNGIKASGDLAVHRLAAKAQIAQMEGLKLEAPVGTSTVKETIVLLSASANIISSCTSMVGVDTMKSVASTAPKPRRLIPPPSRLPQWNYLDCSEDCSHAGCYGNCPLPTLIHRVRKPCAVGGHSDYVDISVSKYTEDERPMDEYIELVALQNFSGVWKLNRNVAWALGRPEKYLKNACPNIDEDVWATFLAVIVLQARFAKHRDELELVEHKALQWLEKQNVDTKDILSKATKVLSTHIYTW